MTGAIAAAALAAGLLLALDGARRLRRPSLAERVLPYVRDVNPAGIGSTDDPGFARQVGAVWGRVARAVGESLGSSAGVARRLRRLGEAEDVEAFRVRQATWAMVGAGGAVAVALVAWTLNRPPALALLMLCVSGLVGGCLACDQVLSARVRAHEAEVLREFPTLADLMALSVAAGESPLAALDRVTRVSHGALSRELGRVVAEATSGGTVVRALDDLAVRTGVGSVARFAEAMAVAIDRGTPLVEVLHAQAADVRESARRDLIESGGRREIAMMVPVVFGILPVTLVIAFFPGLAGLHLTSGM